MTSTTITVTCWSSHGSALGLLLFILYTADITELAAKYGVSQNAFADDTHSCTFTATATVPASDTSTLESSCIAEVSRWMSTSRRKLNEDTTELLWNGSDHSIRKLSGNGPTLTLGTNTINASADACCLGVTITPDLRLTKHASIVGDKCFVQLRQLWRVRRSHDADTAATLIRAFVTSPIDYCNCLLANASKVWTDKLQQILNAAARLLTETNKYDPRHTQFLNSDLHWLDVPEMITYKVCLTVFKCLHEMAPPYFSELCIPVAQIEKRRQLRSAARGQCIVPRIKLMAYGKRAFACARPSAWNSLSH